MFKLYERHPSVVVEAIQVTLDNIDLIVNDLCPEIEIFTVNPVTLLMPGTFPVTEYQARVGDWVIKDDPHYYRMMSEGDFKINYTRAYAEEVKRIVKRMLNEEDDLSDIDSYTRNLIKMVISELKKNDQI